ncbi:GntR family transcriptional regulator [Alicyclobacillus fastidiosus]|uniref:GntR family transcriptional regulator n=1 Tax=Alicyclobacillus fastidiosus TaxID=392011 RepID=A0ABV5ABE1_9BACL|nr:GntR family transcriptional regulator [Alicyclobacillus fastidiosus]WEH10455.1 GntR family transcriptional regulator [Alicyclobacillus fastidiosus]
MELTDHSDANEISLKDEIKFKLRNAIITNELKPGQRLVETDIAKQYGTSQVPVREALRGLEEEGLVRTVKYKGAYVTEIELSEAYHIFSLRSDIESKVIELILPKMTQRHFGELYDIIAQMEADIENPRDLSALDTDFHLKLIDWANIDIYSRVWNMCYGRVRRFISFVHPPVHDKYVEMHEKHISLVQVFEKRDVEQAKLAIRAHIMRSFNESKYKIHR